MGSHKCRESNFRSRALPAKAKRYAYNVVEWVGEEISAFPAFVLVVFFRLDGYGEWSCPHAALRGTESAVTVRFRGLNSTRRSRKRLCFRIHRDSARAEKLFLRSDKAKRAIRLLLFSVLSWHQNRKGFWSRSKKVIGGSDKSEAEIGTHRRKSERSGGRSLPKSPSKTSI
jgi:hypothetical protein